MRWLLNFGINLTAVVIFLILFLVSIFGVGKRNKVGNLFASLLFTVLLSEIAATFYYILLYVESDNYTLYYLTSSLRYIFTYASAVLLFLYFVFYFNLRLVNKGVAIFLSVLSGVIYTILIFVNISNPIFFTFNLSEPFKGYHMIREDFYPLVHLFNFIVFTACLLITFTRRKILLSERISFIALPALLAITLGFDITFREYSIYSMGLIAAFLFHFLFYFIRRGMMINKLQNELTNQQVNIMISQIQPHFIYNCLSAISYLCVQDGKKAQGAIEDFSNYLRGNFSNISNIRMIPFSKELEHTQAYLRLEKMRFDDRVNIKYDIKVTDFLLPSLTLQPIVENAVKHGICKRPEGGTVEISTWEDNNNIYIRVKDDGVGFDPNAPIKEEDRAHIGLKNVESRLTHMSFGKISINSEVNVGTTVTIELPKYNENKGKESKHEISRG